MSGQPKINVDHASDDERDEHNAPETSTATSGAEGKKPRRPSPSVRIHTSEPSATDAAASTPQAGALDSDKRTVMTINTTGGSGRTRSLSQTGNLEVYQGPSHPNSPTGSAAGSRVGSPRVSPQPSPKISYGDANEEPVEESSGGLLSPRLPLHRTSSGHSEPKSRPGSRGGSGGSRRNSETVVYHD
jgi:hypothetical protein